MGDDETADFGAGGRFLLGASMRARLATILRRLSVTGGRRRRAARPDAEDPLARISRIAESYGDSGDTEYAIVLQHVGGRLKKAFDRLPQADRVPFLQLARGGLSHGDIAVRDRIHRARIRLEAAIRRPGRGERRAGRPPARRLSSG